MVALYAMVQLSAAISTVTFVAVTGASGLAGLGPAIFLTTAALMSYSVMVGMMTLAGYILLGHGHHQGAVFPVISAHFVGMFGLVLFVGGIIDRAGPRVALVGGLLLLGLSVLAVVWTVDSVALTALALFGIGLGWDLSFVAATAELVDLTSPVERGKILGFNDLLSGLLGATLALLGGVAEGSSWRRAGSSAWAWRGWSSRPSPSS